MFLGVESSVAGVVDERRTARRFARLVAETGIELPPRRLARSLRVADQQKAEILRAIVRNARLIVMDEPTSALTLDESERLFEVIRRLQELGTTIVYVSHFLPEVLEVADTVTVLRDGRAVRTGPAAEETPEKLVSAMLGRSVELTFPEKEAPAHDAPIVLSVRGLSRPPAMQDVSFEIRAGEIVGLAGLIGSGRSEVARAIFGADRLDDGTLELDGKPFRARSPRDAIRAGVVMLPEDRKTQGLFMLRSVLDNVTLPHLEQVSRAGVVSMRAERRTAGDVVTSFEVLFARWLFSSPKVFIADEPTRGVDVGAKLAIYDLIHSLAKQGIAVLLISSEHEEVLGLAHRVLVMRAGRIVAEFHGKTMSEDAVLRAAFAMERVA